MKGKGKVYIKRAVSIAAMVLALVLFVLFSQEFFLARFDSNEIRVDGFYAEDKNSVDVVLIGASDLYSGYSPGIAYDKFGYTSYLFATGANPISIYESQIKEVLAHQSPKMIVIELNGALYKDSKKLYDTGNLHKYIDDMPYSLNKLQTIAQLVPFEKQSEFYIPFLKYHGIWSDYPSEKKEKWLTARWQLQSRGYSLLKGSNIIADIAKPAKDVKQDLSDDDSRLPLDPESEEYFRNLLTYLKDNNINNVVFVRFPHHVDNKVYDRYQRTNRIGDIIKEYGYDFYNYERYMDKVGIDLNTDFGNSEHLNVYGNEKMTDCIGKLLTEEYGVTPSQLTDKQKEEWKNSVDYTKRYIEYVKEKTDSKSGEWIAEDSKTVAVLDSMPSQA
ncbi:MAG: hypothetical protein SOZ45_03075 [Ruminococcus sp.]|nr:hypothetical protein [Ruminococcus sp.]